MISAEYSAKNNKYFTSFIPEKSKESINAFKDDRTNQPFTYYPDKDGNGGELRDGLLVPGKTDYMQSIIVNGGLSKAIPNVVDIKLNYDPNSIIWDYEIMVTVQCGGVHHFQFTDETHDTYNLWIASPLYGTHVVCYNSKKPAIIKIRYWDDQSQPVVGSDGK